MSLNFLLPSLRVCVLLIFHLSGWNNLASIIYVVLITFRKVLGIIPSVQKGQLLEEI